MKTFEQLWYQGQALSLRFSQLKNVVQNPATSAESLETFINGIQKFEAEYEPWKREMIESLEALDLGILQLSKENP